MTDQAIKTRKMSPKGFLAKSTKANVSASAFFAAHREYMVSGELAHVLSPLVAKVDSREMMPTPALIELQKVVMDHIIMSAIGKLEAGIEEESSKGTTKAWKATILNEAGEVQTRINAKGEEEDLVKGFDLGSQADGWADRRLFLDCSSDCYAVIEHTSLNVKTIITRQDALARMLKKKKGPSVHVSGQSTKSLGFGCHVKQKRVSFSHG